MRGPGKNNSGGETRDGGRTGSLKFIKTRLDHYDSVTRGDLFYRRSSLSVLPRNYSYGRRPTGPVESGTLHFEKGINRLGRWVRSGPDV